MFQFEDVFIYFQCSKCDCLQIAKIPDNIEKYYPSNYYSYTLNKSLISNSSITKFLKKILYNYSLSKFGLIKYFYNIIFKLYSDDLLRSLINVNLSKKDRILDVGCGAGSYLYLLKELNFHNLLGIDPFISHDIVYENNLIIKKMKFENIDGKWDIIMFHHSLEHIPNQKLIFNKISELLDKEGVCIIRIPTVSSYAWKIYGINWVQVDSPRHYFIHSIKSILYLCKLYGLYIKRIIYDSTEFQFWASEQYLRNIPLYSNNSYLINPSKSIFSQKQMNYYKKNAFRLNKQNQGDQAIFYIYRLNLKKH